MTVRLVNINPVFREVVDEILPFDKHAQGRVIATDTVKKTSFSKKKGLIELFVQQSSRRPPQTFFLANVEHLAAYFNLPCPHKYNSNDPCWEQEQDLEKVCDFHYCFTCFHQAEEDAPDWVRLHRHLPFNVVHYVLEKDVYYVTPTAFLAYIDILSLEILNNVITEEKRKELLKVECLLLQKSYAASLPRFFEVGKKRREFYLAALKTSREWLGVDIADFDRDYSYRKNLYKEEFNSIEKQLKQDLENQ